MPTAGMTGPSEMTADSQLQEAEPLTLPDIVEVDYIERNRAAWERWAPGYRIAGRKAWEEPLCWGIWGIPESEAQLLHASSLPPT